MCVSEEISNRPPKRVRANVEACLLDEVEQIALAEPEGVRPAGDRRRNPTTRISLMAHHAEPRDRVTAQQEEPTGSQKPPYFAQNACGLAHVVEHVVRDGETESASFEPRLLPCSSNVHVPLCLAGTGKLNKRRGQVKFVGSDLLERIDPNERVFRAVGQQMDATDTQRPYADLEPVPLQPNTLELTRSPRREHGLLGEDPGELGPVGHEHLPVRVLRGLRVRPPLP